MNLLGSRRGRTFLFTALYLSEGAPIGFIWFALPTILRRGDLELANITALSSVLVLPWVGKFLWAPLVDNWRTSRFGFRGWIMAAQLAMGLTLLPLLNLDPLEHFRAWQVLLLLHALAAATQDVAIDALAVRCVEVHERGRINGCMQAGMLLGRSLVAGGALWLWDRWGQAAILVGLIGVTWISLAALLWVREPTGTLRTKDRGRWRSFGDHLAGAFRHRSMWLGLIFALTGAAAFELTGALAGPFLTDYGATPEALGIFYAVGTVMATLIGGLVGGPVSDRIGRGRAVAWFLIGFVLMVGALAAISLWVDRPSVRLLMGVLLGMYGFVGLFTASSYALFMDLTDPRLGATQFSTFMAATNGCESWTVRAGGHLAQQFGYATGLLTMGIVSLSSLLVLRAMPGSAGRSRQTTSACHSPPECSNEPL